MERRTMKQLTIIIMLFCITAGIYADGSKIGRYISFEELVSKTPYIFSAKILKVDHYYRERKAYGENRRYVSRYRFKVTIQSVYKADKEFKYFIKNKNTFWIERASLTIPGKWVLIEEKYRENISPGAVKKGDIIIIYGTYLNSRVLHFDNCDTMKREKLLTDFFK